MRKTYMATEATAMEQNLSTRVKIKIAGTGRCSPPTDIGFDQSNIWMAVPKTSGSPFQISFFKVWKTEYIRMDFQIYPDIIFDLSNFLDYPLGT